MDVTNLISLAAELPENVASNAMDLLERMGSTIEGIGDGDIEWKPPILKVVQATTDRSSLPKGTNIGDIVVGDEKIEQPLRVIPLRMWDSRQMWSPDKDDNRVLCWSPDAAMGITGQECRKCPHQIFNEAENKVDCTKNKTFLCITSDFRHIIQINFSKTNYSSGMEWQGLLKKAAVATYRRSYDLHTESSKKHKNVEALVVTPVALPEGNTSQEVRGFLEALFTRISEDRKAYLIDFKEAATARAQQSLIASSGEPQGLIEATAEAVAPEQSEQATKYSL